MLDNHNEFMHQILHHLSTMQYELILTSEVTVREVYKFAIISPRQVVLQQRVQLQNKLEFGYLQITAIDLGHKTTLDNILLNFLPSFLEGVNFLVRRVKERSKRGEQSIYDTFSDRTRIVKRSIGKVRANMIQIKFALTPF